MEYTTIEPTQKANKCVIFMHGLGASGDDLSSIVPQLNLPESNKIRFIFPNAPMRPITINSGYVMRGWYDIVSLTEIGRKIDTSGIIESIKHIDKIIDQQKDLGILSENIMLAGFSQGGVIALYASICSKNKLSGCIALSTYLPDWDTMSKFVKEINQEIDIIIGHGTNDGVVPIKIGIEAFETLKNNGYKCKWLQYSMEHEICQDEMKDIREFITKKLVD